MQDHGASERESAPPVSTGIKAAHVGVALAVTLVARFVLGVGDADAVAAGGLVPKAAAPTVGAVSVVLVGVAALAGALLPDMGAPGGLVNSRSDRLQLLAHRNSVYGYDGGFMHSLAVMAAFGVAALPVAALCGKAGLVALGAFLACYGAHLALDNLKGGHQVVLGVPEIAKSPALLMAAARGEGSALAAVGTSEPAPPRAKKRPAKAASPGAPKSEAAKRVNAKGAQKRPPGKRPAGRGAPQQGGRPAGGGNPNGASGAPPEVGVGQAQRRQRPPSGEGSGYEEGGGQRQQRRRRGPSEGAQG